MTAPTLLPRQPPRNGGTPHEPRTGPRDGVPADIAPGSHGGATRPRATHARRLRAIRVAVAASAMGRTCLWSAVWGLFGGQMSRGNGQRDRAGSPPPEAAMYARPPIRCWRTIPGRSTDPPCTRPPRREGGRWLPRCRRRPPYSPPSTPCGPTRPRRRECGTGLNSTHRSGSSTGTRCWWVLPHGGPRLHAAARPTAVAAHHMINELLDGEDLPVTHAEPSPARSARRWDHPHPGGGHPLLPGARAPTSNHASPAWLTRSWRPPSDDVGNDVGLRT
jgi:hypothetical protein